MENKKRTVWISLAVVLVAAVLFGAYFLLNPGHQGAKEISLTVVGADGGTLLTKTYHTDAESLGLLLEENKLAVFQQSTYGRFIVAVDGIVADSSRQQWWNIGYNGADATVGADGLKIKTGDKIVLALKTAGN
jgi:hypothetical protein